MDGAADDWSQSNVSKKHHAASSFRREGSASSRSQSASIDGPPAKRDSTAVGAVDSRYEFSAPKYFDFVDGKEDPKIDSWFDEKHPSPAHPSHLQASDGVFNANGANFFVALTNSPLRSPAKRETRHSRRLQGSAGRILKPSAQTVESAPSTPLPISSQPKSSLVTPEPAPKSALLRTEDFPVIEATSKKRQPSHSLTAHPYVHPTDNRLPVVKHVDPFLPLTVPIRSTKPLTVPREFHFATDERSHPMKLRERGVSAPRKLGGGVQKKMQKKITATKKATIAATHVAAITAKPKTRSQHPEPTVPKPFTFHSTHTAANRSISQADAARSPFVPLAVRVKTFETMVPDRFKAKPAVGAHSELEEFPSQINTAQVTIPKDQNEAEARDTILEATEPLGVPKKPPPSLTVPESPAIHKPRPPPPRETSPIRVVKANPVPDLSKPDFQPVLEHRVVLPQPIQLPGDFITERKRKEHEENVKKMQEEEKKARQFKARPLPDDEPDALPDVPIKPATKPEPFPLRVDQRGQVYQTRFQHQIELEQHEKENAANFRAHPLQDSAPFVPKKSTKPLTVADDLTLFTEIRAEERKEFDEEIRAKEQEEKRRREQAEKEQEMAQKLETRRLRELANPKALPIKHFAPIVIKPSIQKLTEPVSPMIGEKRKRVDKERGKSKLGIRANRSFSSDD
ncbi:Protein tpx2 [Gonapodya sp. JEL0774]|nr:Protein tpx2 [Gonapodya sp. JEL0774]